MCRRYRLDEQWLPDLTSAQTVADRLTRFGTFAPDHADPAGEHKIWVGAPLRVHRRCDRPMFDVSNRIAYAGGMVFGTPDRDSFPGRDCWVHVPPSPSASNWLPAEGEALRQLLRHLATLGPPTPDLAVLSPFRAVIVSIKEPVERIFPKATVGTAHTMQGRESDVVVLVLGGNPTGDVRDWVIRTPNLLNVAVSRAKRRLYVIGDRDDWQQRRYAKDLAAMLPVGTPF